MRIMKTYRIGPIKWYRGPTIVKFEGKLELSKKSKFIFVFQNKCEMEVSIQPEPKKYFKYIL